MLVLNRKKGQRIVIGNQVVLTVLEVHGDRVKLGFHGPDDVPIHREEVYRKILGDGQSQDRGSSACGLQPARVG